MADPRYRLVVRLGGGGSVFRHPVETQAGSAPPHCPKSSPILELGLGRGQFARDDGVIEALAAMGAIAEGLVGGLAAAAEGDDGASGETEGGAGGIEDFASALGADVAVIDYRYFCGH